MGSGLSNTYSFVEIPVEEAWHFAFPAFKDGTDVDVTSHDLIRGQTTCAEVLKISSSLELMDPRENLHQFAPMICFYEQYYSTLTSSYPQCTILKKSTTFRLIFLSELINIILSADIERDNFFCWITKYEREGFTPTEYGAIGEALVSTLGSPPPADTTAKHNEGSENSERYKIATWRRIYSRFLRLVYAHILHGTTANKCGAESSPASPLLKL